MARRNEVPPYRLHKGSGQAFVYHKSIANKSHRIYLGKYGTEVSKRKYRQFLARLEVNQTAPSAPPPSSPTIIDVAMAWDQHADAYYRDEDGLRTREYAGMWTTIRILLDLFGDALAEEFGPKSLKMVQRAMIERDYCRTHINQATSRIKRFFKWAASEEIIDPTCFHRLLCVRGLRPNELGVREPEPIKPVTIEQVQKLLPFVSPTVGAMLQVQYLCAMRPDEVCRIRRCDLDMSGDIWLFKPAKHKTRRFGRVLVKGIPKSAQLILEPFVSQSEKGDSFVFDPRKSAEWRRRTPISRTRKTKLYPCEAKRVEEQKRLAAGRPHKRMAGERYTKDSYGRAIKRGIEKAAKHGVAVEQFSPNQLRHSIITFIAKTIGQQKAQRYAGHAQLSTTSIYAEIEVDEIMGVARQLDQIWRKDE